MSRFCIFQAFGLDGGEDGLGSVIRHPPNGDFYKLWYLPKAGI